MIRALSYLAYSPRIQLLTLASKPGRFLEDCEGTVAVWVSSKLCMTDAWASGTAPSCITYPFRTLLACAEPLMSIQPVIVGPHGLAVELSSRSGPTLLMSRLQLYAKASMSPLPVSRWPSEGDVCKPWRCVRSSMWFREHLR